MPTQHKCVSCKCTIFYIMLQDDGSIECFCSTSNHRQVLVNLTDLTQHIMKGLIEDAERETATGYLIPAEGTDQRGSIKGETRPSDSGHSDSATTGGLTGNQSSEQSAPNERG